MPDTKKNEIQTVAQNTLKFYLVILTSIILWACSDKISTTKELKDEVHIFPDYSGITFPPNIAPLNFIIDETAKEYLVKIFEKGSESITIKSSTGKICKIFCYG